MSPCPACEGRRYVIVEQAGYEVAKRCEACLPSITERLRSAGVPPRELDWRIDNLTERHLERIALRILDAMRGETGDPTRCVLLLGANGRGKTCIAVAVLAELLKDGKRVRYVSVREWLLQLRRSYQAAQRDALEPAEGELLDPLLNAPFLLLDDLGAEHNISPWVRQMVGHVIHDRHVNCRATLVTSNLPLRRVKGIDGIHEIYGGHVGSRLSEYRMFTPPETAPDLRARKKEIDGEERAAAKARQGSEAAGHGQSSQGDHQQEKKGAEGGAAAGAHESGNLELPWGGQ